MNQPVQSQMIDETAPVDPNMAPGVPDLAQQVYTQVGLDPTGVTVQGSQALMSQLKPGDLVGWKGGHMPDGSYAGNIAVYAGDGDIIESFFGTTRRRKIHYDENVFGIPVNFLGDVAETDAGVIPSEAGGPVDNPDVSA